MIELDNGMGSVGLVSWCFRGLFVIGNRHLVNQTLTQRAFGGGSAFCDDMTRVDAQSETGHLAFLRIRRRYDI
jgi:hypothetical protein